MVTRLEGLEAEDLTRRRGRRIVPQISVLTSPPDPPNPLAVALVRSKLARSRPEIRRPHGVLDLELLSYLAF